MSFGDATSGPDADARLGRREENGAGAFAELEARLGHRFADPALLRQALMLGPDTPETREGRQRLEFLGDAVLELVVSAKLYDARSDWDEGDMTRARARLVGNRNLVNWAEQLGLAGPGRSGRGEAAPAAAPQKTPADTFEAVIAALFLDGDLAPVARLVERLLPPPRDWDALLSPDAKTELNELAHTRGAPPPVYRTVDDSREENASKRFAVEVWFDGAPAAKARGRTKRAAEQRAAERALQGLAAAAPRAGRG